DSHHSEVTMMSRRTATLSPLLGLVAVLTLALPVMAKTGAEARLDTTLHRDATPGSRIAVAWSLFQVVDDKESPFSASGVYMRLKGADGKSATEVLRAESRRRQARHGGPRHRVARRFRPLHGHHPGPGQWDR